MKAKQTNFTVFLFVSVGLHVLFIAAWHTDTDSDISINQATAPIQLQLAAATSQSSMTNKTIATKPLRKPARNPKPATNKTTPGSDSESRRATSLTRQTKPGRKPTVTRAPLHDTSDEPSPSSATQQASNSMPPAPATREQQQQLGARIQKQLRVKIAFHRHYPDMAIRNAWEGQVKLGIRVQANGNLTDIHIINSSGYSILDRAAVSSVRHVAALPEASRWLQGQSIDVILPIIYKLTDS